MMPTVHMDTTSQVASFGHETGTCPLWQARASPSCGMPCEVPFLNQPDLGLGSTPRCSVQQLTACISDHHWIKAAFIRCATQADQMHAPGE